MFAVCIESSHQKGMGRLFRALNFVSCLENKNEKYIIIVNDSDEASVILKRAKINFETADINDHAKDWETILIKKHGVNTWVNDRLDTDKAHAQNVKKNNIKLFTIDDNGSGAEMADINFGSMPCNYNKDLKGKSVKSGIDFFILNGDVNRYKRVRNNKENIIVTLGGSDTYGVTLNVVKALKKTGLSATIIIGPSFKHKEELWNITAGQFNVKESVPSLVEEMYNYDIAITGGGITPFEANASGLPCFVIASESHEVDNGKYLQELGSSVFLGYYDQIETLSFPLDRLDVEKMSRAGMDHIPSNGSDNIYNAIKAL